MNEEQIPTESEIKTMHNIISSTDTQVHIVRQNCLTHADAWISKCEVRTEEDAKALKKAYFEFAKECENWVFRPKGD